MSMGESLTCKTFYVVEMERNENMHIVVNGGEPLRKMKQDLIDEEDFKIFEKIDKQ